MLTVIVNDVDNCSVSDIFSHSFQTSKKIGKNGIKLSRTLSSYSSVTSSLAVNRRISALG